MMQKHQISELLTPELQAELRRLHFSTRRLINADLVGSYRSAFRGHGIEFEEVREYTPGDEIRRIDWKVTARRGFPYIKTYREERELSLLLALDTSSSMFTGSRQQLRTKLMTQISALLALIASRNNDRIGLLTFSSQVDGFYPPKRGRKQLAKILSNVLLPLAAASGNGSDSSPLTSHQAQGKYPQNTALAEAAEFILRTVRKHTIVIFISDFFAANYQDAFAKVAHSHELIAMRCLDKLDLQLPDAGLCYLRHPETGRVSLVNTSSSAMRLLHAREIERSRDYLNKLAEQYRFRTFEIFTDEPFMPILRRFFSQPKSDIRRR